MTVRQFGFVSAGLLAVLAACAHAHGEAHIAKGVRVAVLTPSFSDDLLAVGARRQIVGVSSYTRAPSLARLPRIADALGVDAEAIVALHPSVVVGIPSQERAVLPLRRAGLRVVLLPDDSLSSIFTDLRALGALTGHARQAQALVVRLRRQTARLRARTRAFVRHPRVFVVLDADPIWTAGAGSYIATLIRMAGGRNAAGNLQAAYGEYSAEALLRDQPDAIVADREMHLGAVLGREPWRSLRAVRLGRVYIADRATDLQRPGPSYTEGLRWLIERLTPLATRR